MNIFPCISLETPYMCVEMLKTAHFSQTIHFRGHISRITPKIKDQ